MSACTTRKRLDPPTRRFAAPTNQLSMIAGGESQDFTGCIQEGGSAWIEGRCTNSWPSTGSRLVEQGGCEIVPGGRCDSRPFALYILQPPWHLTTTRMKYRYGVTGCLDYMAYIVMSLLGMSSLDESGKEREMECLCVAVALTPVCITAQTAFGWKRLCCFWCCVWTPV
jgi:hypothetical protein